MTRPRRSDSELARRAVGVLGGRFSAELGHAEDLSALRRQAEDAGVDLRDLEAALVRLALAHRRTMTACPGGPSCSILAGRREQDAPPPTFT